ncbi:hypothetical protein SAMN02910340_02100 [Methanosarcina thermophila]|jgi:hypothetical protein|uniref:Uncharacterized protein n=1 Tax=Methanosarcina thermophila TaxID=2210 RepID=A0A1I7AEX0_METTE|nr:hypothetical protein [Methanosarcina thermophila]ALK06161.1 MAG: hypothetical protein AAY43_11295 [Methanosarcina sp. 795]SFT73474.1 hypothetical protein SAMN02910340_02100 [Methanosarcina thermophila]BAW29910.1 conserved hypothetical protein [Methanosarcina thermophila]GLI14187.1 hypothetical protein MTHERMMSTA1_13130 [Methanosarcina thermophila MST-A1]HOA69150.1 hypothetical protein [Methanosarcina thermophila]
MYAWATKDYLLDEMTLDQIIMYYRKGWEARKLSAQVFWGVLGEIMQGKDPAEAVKSSGVSGLEKFKEAHPEGQSENGAWKVSR